MKMKQLLMTTIAIFGLATITNAQVPNYIPTNGLVGWWPFTGNSIDESINSNDGIVNGATLSTDRFGNLNSSYSFNGVNNYIDCGVISSLNNSSAISISAWIKYSSIVNSSRIIGADYVQNSNYGWSLALDNYFSNNSLKGIVRNNVIQDNGLGYTGQVLQPGVVYHTVMVFDGSANNNANKLKLFIDGIQQAMTFYGSIPNTLPTTNFHAIIGGQDGSATDCPWNGILDDIGIWNRALTQQEIAALYNAPNCSNNLTISPASNQLQTGNTATFSATTSDANPNFVWQSDFGQGYVTLNNYGNYLGVNTNSLSISNVQLSEHNQPIRVISTSGECIDTSNFAAINVTDTCIVSIYDTITTFISVTDTLVINTQISGLTPPNNLNTIKVFPNPTNDHVTIDYDNFVSMNGYILKITNSIGQTVFTTPINQQSSYVDLSTWGGNGIYFVQIINTQNNTIENRKIVLQ